MKKDIKQRWSTRLNDSKKEEKRPTTQKKGEKINKKKRE